jgi:hypothetical protein
MSDDPRTRKPDGETGRVGDTQAPPTTAPEALDKARQHAHAALHEALAAVQALLDAASLAVSGERSEAHRLLAPVVGILEKLTAELNGDVGREATILLDSIAVALDTEIARWEDRAKNDVEARAVLRAFIGLRELLWEFGVRHESEGDDSDAASRRAPRKAGRGSSRGRRRTRVQRVPVEG